MDISDPTEPFTVGRFDAPPDLHSIAVAVGGDDAQPVRTATAPQLHGRDIALVGDRAYLSCYLTGLAIVDISDPYAPRTDGGFYTGTSALAVAADSELVLLNNQDADVWILVDDPATSAPAPVTFDSRSTTSGAAAWATCWTATCQAATTISPGTAPTLAAGPYRPGSTSRCCEPVTVGSPRDSAS